MANEINEVFVLMEDDNTVNSLQIFKNYEDAVKEATKKNLPIAERILNNKDYQKGGCYSNEDSLPFDMSDTAEVIARNMAKNLYKYHIITEDYNEYENIAYSFFYVIKKYLW